jgi:hypothetical protein
MRITDEQERYPYYLGAAAKNLITGEEGYVSSIWIDDTGTLYPLIRVYDGSRPTHESIHSLTDAGWTIDTRDSEVTERKQCLNGSSNF